MSHAYRILVSKKACCSGYNLSPRLIHHRISQLKAHTKLCTRYRSTFFSTSTAINKGKEKFRVAIVGGGASGLSLALHLAPLAERGLIATPIDLYERSSLDSVHPHENVENVKNGAAKDENFHPGTGTIGRDIGVGIWNTALEPFLHLHSSTEKGGSKPRETHVNLIKNLMDLGHWVGNVGYRTPNGQWLTRNSLDTSDFKKKLSAVSSSQPRSSTEDESNTKPGLLFIREKDFLTSLRDAVFAEQKKNTIKTHYAKSDSDNSTTVEGILIPESRTQKMSGQLLFADQSVSSPDTPYNLVIASDGMNSILRSKYGGDESPETQRKQHENGRTKYERTIKSEDEPSREKNAVEDRQYTVFRGTSPLNDLEAGTNGESFQTWGEEKSMRFAVVGMSHPTENRVSEDRVQKQVWFATTTDSATSAIEDAVERKQKIMSCFQNWHDPICQLIGSTPADEILMERAVAHKHVVYPVFSIPQIQQHQYESQTSEKKITGYRDFGSGPLLLFSGDAHLTVDPVLAQGFTIAMEASADLAHTLDIFLASGSSSSSQFDMDKFQNAMSIRCERRVGRMLCLLRATDLVQALAQPRTGSISGFLSKNIVRPAINFAPDFLKKPAFAFVMKYSLGLYGNFAFTDIKGVKITTKL